jgi:hypothetical protein
MKENIFRVAFVTFGEFSNSREGGVVKDPGFLNPPNINLNTYNSK